MACWGVYGTKEVAIELGNGRRENHGSESREN